MEMTGDSGDEDVIEEMEEKLMEAKVFLSEARYTNINVDSVKDKIRKAVDLKQEGEYEESIKYSEKAIEQADIILNMYEKLKSGKKKIIHLKEKGEKHEDILDKLRHVKDLTDEGQYHEARKKLDDLFSILDDKSLEEERDKNIRSQIMNLVPEEGITIYSLSKKMENTDEQELKKIIASLEKSGHLEVSKKGRWKEVRPTGKRYITEEKKEYSIAEEPEEDREDHDDNLLEIPLNEHQNKILTDVWKEIFVENIDQKTVELLGWDEKDNFFKDILFYGLHRMKKEPERLIEEKIISELEYLDSEKAKDIIQSEFEKQLDLLD